MPSSRTTGRPRAAALLAAVAAGVALGAAGAVAAGALSEQSEPELLFGGLDAPVFAGRAELERMTVGLTVHNHGAADFAVADIRIPGWTLSEPDAADVTIPAETWALLSLDLVVDCSASAPQLDLEVVADDGRTVALERDGVGPGGLASVHLRACVEQGMAPPGVMPAVETGTARTDLAGGGVHVDVDVVAPADAAVDFRLGAVTGHASGFTVELADRPTELRAGTATTVTTDWRVRDCGGAAGTTGTGEPDLSSSGNFDGFVMHLYWDDPARSEPIRTDLPVDLPPGVVAELARFAVMECGAGT